MLGRMALQGVEHGILATLLHQPDSMWPGAWWHAINECSPFHTHLHLQGGLLALLDGHGAALLLCLILAGLSAGLGALLGGEGCLKAAVLLVALHGQLLVGKDSGLGVLRTHAADGRKGEQGAAEENLLGEGMGKGCRPSARAWWVQDP